MPSVCGRRPVSSALRDGAQTAWLQYARVEAHAARGESVDVRRTASVVAVAAEQRLQVVDADQQHVGASGFNGVSGECGTAKAK